MMNFLNLEYFLTAAEELNFTKAAKKLFISQQSLSSHISKLENDLGVELFNRTVPLTLTPAGKSLVKNAVRILDLKEQSVKELADIKDFKRGDLFIGASHTRGRAFLPEILPYYNERFPNINLHLLEGNSKELDAALLKGDVDLIIGMLPFNVENVEIVPLCNEEVLMVVPDNILVKYFPNNYMEVKQKLEKDMDITVLKDCPFLMVNAKNRVRIIADEMFNEKEIKPNIILETESIETVLALSVKGMGITFYPKTLMNNKDLIFDKSTITGVNLYHLKYNKTHGTLGIGYQKNRYVSQALKEFIELAKDKYGNIE
ncbi:LysR family transcriptional regulator [Clostridium beijerinckii]|jgi:transcriptional regulator, LysR family|uniref:LysR family transcriptional regulator n=2 Tax=Clostridium beijerinckii TaxID=1520 RepID=A0AAE2RRG9_CLOBE|nr:LysR family transcriptional regulator [Clostridium beijerinckii]ABR35014.1 transcriptional regulator, LysR family [Clostridium beijerinckii NCIMB 8052]AIU03595.1 LysR family transcriptional regulator [Clostridium beijerinckii ATCC 35702]MBF7810350.1 LysR family transcriptional regulator [Clostridium beijerinckii]NRT23607.1 DNA-binding transcriptional LysR family regulator [Clostridium beijerinckii]NRT68816.1 DNA-binding transcriptional LysR family regulator [Clostridium beijerinckii]